MTTPETTVKRWQDRMSGFDPFVVSFEDARNECVKAEIAELRAQLADLQPRGTNSVLVPATELAKLRAQVEQYREDAERFRAIEHDFSVMSPNIDGNHYWIWRGRGYRGPNLRAAIDKARKA